MAKPRRELTDGERLVLLEVQIYWGDQNTVDDVSFTDRGDAVLFVHAADGSTPVAVGLTTLAGWFQEGSLSLEALRQQIKGPSGA